MYLERIQAALSELGGVEVVPAANPRRRSPAGGGLGSVRNLLGDQAWTAFSLPRRARATGADLIHHALPGWASATRVPQVITVHDLAFERLPECFDRGFRTYAHLAHRAAARRARAVICVSETTADDVREVWGVPEERVIVARHGPGQALPDREPAPEPSHFLYVGDAEPRKDLPTLLAAYADYRRQASSPLDLVLAGRAAAPGQPGVRAESEPGPARLAELLAAAVALVHPARYEGFGFTPLEAMAAGTPVIAARAPGTTEVCADAVRYFEPGDAHSLAASLIWMAGQPDGRRGLREAGRAQAARFSWTASARDHAAAYSLALQR